MRAEEFLSEKVVQSSWISNITYNRPNKTLTMVLSNGNTYTIPASSRTEFEKWVKSGSKGQFFHNSIKPRHTITKIK